MRKKTLFLMVSVLLAGSARGQEAPRTDTLGVEFHFKRGYSTLDPLHGDNSQRMESFIDRLDRLRQDTSCRIRIVQVISGTSPEGSENANTRLAKKRSENVFRHINGSIPSLDVPYEMLSRGEDWAGLAALVAASDMPGRDDVLEILRNTPVWVIRDGRITDSRKRQLGMLRGGRPWRHMEEHFFPELRRSSVLVIYESTPAVIQELAEETTVPGSGQRQEQISEQVTDTEDHMPSIPDEQPQARRLPFLMALKTNLLYDVALIPNISAEFHLGRGWSVSGGWMYSWWKNDRRHNYWRTYGGELDIRKYFGRRAAEKPLTGHHLGIYGQMLTYDFELGKRGYQSLFSYGAGIEYGYSLPIGKRLNLDFGIGAGYLGGEYKEYDPVDTHYVWQRTRQRHWFGPTKAEISLVWMIGKFNEKKGGK